VAGRASGVKMEDEGGGSLVSLDGVAVIQIVGVSASNISPCTMKSRRFLLTPAHLGGPGKRAVKWLWCVCVLEPADVPVGASDRCVTDEETEMQAEAAADNDAAQHQSTDELTEQHATTQLHYTAVVASESHQVSSLIQ